MDAANATEADNVAIGASAMGAVDEGENAGSDTVGIGDTGVTAKLVIDQNDGSGAIPVIELDQGDADEPFVNFVGTSAADDSSSISSSTATASAKFGAVMVKINGVEKWIRVYDDPT